MIHVYTGERHWNANKRNYSKSDGNCIIKYFFLVHIHSRSLHNIQHFEFRHFQDSSNISFLHVLFQFQHTWRFVYAFNGSVIKTSMRPIFVIIIIYSHNKDIFRVCWIDSASCSIHSFMYTFSKKKKMEKKISVNQ